MRSEETQAAPGPSGRHVADGVFGMSHGASEAPEAPWGASPRIPVATLVLFNYSSYILQCGVKFSLRSVMSEQAFCALFLTNVGFIFYSFIYFLESCL